jgi:hypothetical protein
VILRLVNCPRLRPSPPATIRDMEPNQTIEGVLTEFRGLNDCAVRLSNGQLISAAMDAEALRAAHGRVYGINVGRSVRVVCAASGRPARIVWIEQI